MEKGKGKREKTQKRKEYEGVKEKIEKCLKGRNAFERGN